MAGEEVVPKKEPFWSLIQSDLRRGRRGLRPRLNTLLFNQGFKAVFWYRIAHAAASWRLRFIAHFLTYLTKRRFGIEISPFAVIGPGFQLIHGFGTVVGIGSRIGKNCTLYHQVTLGTAHPLAGEVDYPILSDDVAVYCGAKILGPVRIGKGATIAANAVVTQDVPEECVAGGIPAKVIGHPPKASTTANLEKIRSDKSELWARSSGDPS